MITGRRAFDGKSQASLISAIMSADPPPMAVSQPLTPAALDHVVRTCLAKDREDRWQTAADLKRELKWMTENREPVAVPVGTRSRRRLHLLLAFLFGGLLASITTWALKSSPSSSSRGIARVLVGVAPADYLPAKSRSTVMALSPDGTHLVFVAVHGETQQLYVRALDRLDAAPIAGTEVSTSQGARLESPFFSPDGQWIGFWTGSAAGGALKKVRLDGGPATTLCPTPSPYGVSWSTSDAIVFANSGSGGLWRVSPSGGTPQSLTTVDAKNGEVSHRFPQVLPGGQAVLFTVLRASRRWDDAQVVVKSIRTGAQHLLVEGGADARYLPTGHLVFARTGTLMAVPFDLARLDVSAGAVALVEDVGQAIDNGQADGGTGAAQFSVSTSGSLAYVTGGVEPDPERSLVWVDRSGGVAPLAATRRDYIAPRLSPDGQRIAVFTGAGNQQVWVYDIARDSMTRLTTNEVRPYSPIWTLDGKRVVFGVGGLGNLFWKPRDSTEPAEPLTTDERAAFAPSSWSPDGKSLAFVKAISPTHSEIWVLSLENGAWRTRPLLKAASGESRQEYPEFSPDGHWLAYVSNESGRNEVYALPVPGSGGRQQISTEGGVAPAWSRSNHELFYTVGVPNTSRMKVMEVEVRTEPTWVASKPRTLFEGNYRSTAPVRGYDVTPDGRRFLMVRLDTQPPAPAHAEIMLVLNWLEELKRRVPTK
jgi:serine/threonine-protein kinase